MSNTFRRIAERLARKSPEWRWADSWGDVTDINGHKIRGPVMRRFIDGQAQYRHASQEEHDAYDLEQDRYQW